MLKNNLLYTVSKKISLVTIMSVGILLLAGCGSTGTQQQQNVSQVIKDQAAAFKDAGMKKYDQKDYEGAIAEINKAIELYPTYSMGYNDRGLVKYTAGDIPGATQDYNKAIQLDPNNSDAYFNEGLMKYDQKDYNGALPLFDKVIELDPNNGENYNTRGMIKIYNKQIQQGCTDLQKAVSLGYSDASDAIAQNCK